MQNKCIRPSNCTAEGKVGLWCKGCRWLKEMKKSVRMVVME